VRRLLQPRQVGSPTGCRLIEARFAAAATLYQSAVDGAPALAGEHESTWLQACHLMAALEPGSADRAAVRQVFAHLPDCRA
jgi:hypothetical protein